MNDNNAELLAVKNTQPVPRHLTPMMFNRLFGDASTPLLPSNTDVIAARQEPRLDISEIGSV